MTGTIITTADDFGWDDGSVDTTIALLEAGIIRNASIMANVVATAAALDYAAGHPEHGWGVHLTFTRDDREAPVLPPERVPGLVDDQGRFLPGREAQLRAASGRFPADQIAAEAAAQIQRVVDRGITVDYVDSHKHLHKYPVFARVLPDVLPRFGIGCVRRTQTHFAGPRRRRPSSWVGPALQRRIARRWITTQYFFMPDGDEVTRWWDLVPSGVHGSIEVGCHPGRGGWRAHEAAGIEALHRQLAAGGFSPIRWRDLVTDPVALASVST